MNQLCDSLSFDHPGHDTGVGSGFILGTLVPFIPTGCVGVLTHNMILSYSNNTEPSGSNAVSSSSFSGHEFPFSIHMSHVRYSQGGGRDAPPADRLAGQAEQLQVYKQFQFILKPRPVEPPQQHAGKIIHPAYEMKNKRGTS